MFNMLFSYEDEDSRFSDFEIFSPTHQRKHFIKQKVGNRCVYIYNIYVSICITDICICIIDIVTKSFNCHKSFTLFLCRKVTTTRWSEICNLTHLWKSSFFWNVRCIKPVMLPKMSCFTSIFQAFWPQMHLNFVRSDFWSPAFFKPFHMTFEKLVIPPQKKIGINRITFSWPRPITMKAIFVGCWLATIMT